MKRMLKKIWRFIRWDNRFQYDEHTIKTTGE